MADFFSTHHHPESTEQLLDEMLAATAGVVSLPTIHGLAWQTGKDGGNSGLEVFYSTEWGKPEIMCRRFNTRASSDRYKWEANPLHMAGLAIASSMELPGEPITSEVRSFVLEKIESSKSVLEMLLGKVSEVELDSDPVKQIEFLPSDIVVPGL